MTCGAPLSATSPQLGRGKLPAIVIITNISILFNIIPTFFKKNLKIGIRGKGRGRGVRGEG